MPLAPRYEDTVPVENEGIPKAYLPRYEDTTPVGPEAARAQMLQVPRYEDTTPVEAPAPAPKPVTPPPKSDPKPDEETPGYWEIMKSAASRKLAERAMFDATAGQVALPAGVGGKSLQETLPVAHPETKDYVDEMLSQPITEGWTNPKWLVAQLAGAAGGLVPGLGAAAVGTALGGPVGGIVGFGAEAAFGNFIPAYQAAVAAGAPNPIRRALVDSGIAATFAGAMGMIGKIPLASTLGGMISETAAQALERPMAEAIAQLGIAGPGLAAGQDITTDLSHGDLPNWPQVATDAAMGMITGIGVHGLWKGYEALGGRGEQVPATEREIGAAFEAQAARPGFENERARAKPGAEPVAPVAQTGPGEEVPDDGNWYQRDLEVKRPSGRTGFGGAEPDYFYSQLSRAVEDMPENMPAKDVYNFLKRRGVKDAELADTFIPMYLADKSGKVNKNELLSWVESQRVQVFEKVRSDDLITQDPMHDANVLYDDYSRLYGTANMDRWPPRARRHTIQVRNEGLRELERVREEVAPKYRDWGLPGMRINPIEVTFRTPEPVYPKDMVDGVAQMMMKEHGDLTPWDKLPEADKEHERALATIKLRMEDPNIYAGSHYSDPNTFAWGRMYFMKDRDGRLTAVLAEMQSDPHQEATKLIDKDYPEAGRIGYVSERGAATREAEARVKEAEARYFDAYAKWKGTEGWKPSWDKPEELQDLANASLLARTHLADLTTAKRAVPDLPFKTNWQELVAKRMLQLAVNHGATRFAIYNGDQVGIRVANRQELAGTRLNYDKKIPSIFEKLAKQYGETMGETDFPNRPDDIYAGMRPGVFLDDLKNSHTMMGLDLNRVKGPLRSFDLSPKMIENVVKYGHALYDADPEVRNHPPRGTKTLSDYVQTNPTPEHLRVDMAKIGDLVNTLANRLGITRGIEFRREEDPNAKYRGFVEKGVNPVTGNYVMHVNLSRLMTRNDLYASMSHEFGHVVEKNLFKRERPEVQAPIFAAFEAWRDAQSPADRLVGDVRRERDNAISQMTQGRAMHDHYKVSDLVPRSKEYFLSFEEWWAEQVAKWMQTDERPLGVVDQFFKRLGNVIRKAIVAFRKLRDGKFADPEAAVRDYLNSKFDNPIRNLAEDTKQQFDHDTVVRAQAAFDKEGAPETRAVPMQGSSGGGRDIVNGLPPDARGNGEAMAAHADRMNWFYKLFTSLPQIQSLNKNIRQLADYLSMHRNANVEKNTIMGAAKRRLDEWGRLNKDQLAGLTNMVQDYAHMDHRPNQAEFTDLVKRYKLSGQSVNLFKGLVGDFDGFLENYRTLLINDAMKIKDPAQRMNNLQNINTRFDEYQRKPFFPITHFGKYSITIYDHAGNIRHYEQTNTLRRQRQIVEALKGSKDILPGDQVLPGMVPKDAMPFVGMPPGLIDLIGDKLSLSATQRAALDQMRFDYAPAQTFKHQFRNLDLVPGYSTNFPRAYASFFFHGANHVTRIKWIDAMRDQIASLGSAQERLARIGNAGGANKLDMIVKYMQEHLDAWADPKSDWGALRGLMFHYYLGFNPASAAVNLTQTALSTYPWLASKFGDVAATKYIAKASFDINNFYKKGTLLENAANAPKGPEGAWARAAGQAVDSGVLSETQAHQLAAVSEDRNLLRAFGTKAEGFWNKFQEASGWMFDLSEQWNRKVAFNAAWQIGMEKTGHKMIQEAINQDRITYQHLVDPVNKGGLGWSGQEAGAFMLAKHAVEKTQFEYQPFAKPAFMRGKVGGSLFIFKLFTQNMLFNLASNPGMLARWLVIMGAMGGVGGIMGYDNVNSIIKTIAARVFGKDFDLDDEVRHFAHDVLNDRIEPDTLLHGQAVKGFGIPHVMHSMGANWFPTVDMSKSVGMGDVLGFDPMKLMGLAPSLHPKEQELREAQRASGAAFSIPWSIFDFASSNENFGQLKKYESIMPHWLAAMSHSYRWFTQGRETNVAGNTTIRFNPSDTEHMAEILARAAGFQPRRLTEEWGRTQALKEASDFWDLRRQVLIRQYADAVKNDDSESQDRVIAAIAKYNEQLPDEAVGKAITSKGLHTSVRQRLGVAAKQEEGIPVQKSNIPLQQALEPYYPRGWARDQVGARPVE